MWPQFLLLFLSAGLAASCDEDACNIGISAGVGAASTCSVVGGLFCGFTFGIGCAVAAGCGIAGAVAGAGQSACALCGEDQSPGGFSAAQLRNLTEQVLESEQRLQNSITETQDLIKRRSQAVLDGIEKVDQNIMRLAHQMEDVRIDLTKTIKKGALQASYVDDLERFAKFSQSFEDLERGESGLIVNNQDVERFKKAVNDYFLGAEQTYTNIHTMIVGDSLLGQESIFEIDTAFCSSKDYLLYVMQRLIELDATAKFMDGHLVDPVQTERFKTMFINVEQKHIQTCKCPPGQIPEQMNNLQFLVSQPTPKTSAGEFYGRVNGDDTISRTDLKKLSLLYKAKPFDFSPSILTAIRTQRIEVLELINKLHGSNSLNTLPLLENKLLCAEGVKVLVRKSAANPADFFDKGINEYIEGFAANGESWIGLDKLHSLTSQKSYKLKITMTDFDGKKYYAVYDEFKVGPQSSVYVLHVAGFNAAASTLGPNGLLDATGAKFSTKDIQIECNVDHCVGGNLGGRGGWWFRDTGICSGAYLTGHLTNTKTWGRGIWYYDVGERGGDGWDSWLEAEMLLLPN